MKRLVIVFSTFFLLFNLLTQEVKASFVTVEKNGQVVVNVLASETTTLDVPRPSSLAVTSAASEENPERLISLAKNEDRVSLKIGEDKSFDVTSWKDDLVQIEERQDAKKISISLKDGNFIISQEGASAITGYAIDIDPEKNRLTLDTPTGEKYLSILPFDALESALRAKAITKANNEDFKIAEESGNLSYAISGEKSVNLFNVYNLNMPIEAKVSASTGEILSTNEPVWLKLLSFFLS